MTAENDYTTVLLSDPTAWLWPIAIVVTILILAALAYVLLPKILKFFNQDNADPEPAPIEETGPIQEAMNNLTVLLSQIQPNAEEADKKLTDARVWTETLVSHVLGVVEKIELIRSEVGHLSAALDALNTGQREQVAYAAGKVADGDIRRLLLSPYVLTDSHFKVEAIVLISSQLGAREQWSESYQRFASALFGQIAEVKARALSLEQGRDMLQASHPVLIIQKSLNEAQDALRLKSPGIRYAARQSLPGSVSVNLLRG